jgi:hypothetical protein
MVSVYRSTVSLSVPALPAGSYKIEISDRGGVDTSAASFVLAPNPRLILKPDFDGLAFGVFGKAIG